LNSPKVTVGVHCLRIRTKSMYVAAVADPAIVRPAVVEVALQHHLVSAYTSLVAVDVTPTGPAFTKTAMVRSSLPRGYGEVAGALPQTDTEATLELLMGLLALGAAALVAIVGWRAS